MDNKPSFIKFLKKRWGYWSLWLPLWITIVLYNLISSSKILTANGSFSDFIIDAVGGIIFTIILSFVVYLHFGKKSMENKTQKN